MSLRDDLIDKAADLVDDKADGWFDKVLAAGRDIAAPAEGDVEADSEARAAANEALDLLEADKLPFLRLGKLGFAHLIAYWEDDDKAEAQRHYLATQATYAERRAATHKAGDAAAKDRDARIEAWVAVHKTLKQVGTLGLKFLVNLAAKSVGLPFSI